MLRKWGSGQKMKGSHLGHISICDICKHARHTHLCFASPQNQHSLKSPISSPTLTGCLHTSRRQWQYWKTPPLLKTRQWIKVIALVKSLRLATAFRITMCDSSLHEDTMVPLPASQKTHFLPGRQTRQQNLYEKLRSGALRRSQARQGAVDFKRLTILQENPC